MGEIGVVTIDVCSAYGHIFPRLYLKKHLHDK